MRLSAFALAGALFCLGGLCEANAGLEVQVAQPKVSGQTAVIKLALKNTYATNAIESARAGLFVVDEKGKVVGQATRWVLGQGKAGRKLEPKEQTDFFFVVPLQGKLTSTNSLLQAQVVFSRLNLSSGVSADARKDVRVESAAK